MTGDERAGRHADLETLADLHAGVLEGAQAAAVREHVAGCRHCAATLRALDAVQGQLRSLPTPAMPAAVAARLDATLADLRSDRSASGSPPVPDPEDELALARARRGRRLSRSIGAAAAAVVLLAAGGTIASIVRGGSTGSTASTGAGSAATAPAQPQGQESSGHKSARGSFGNDSAGGAPAGAQPVLPAYDEASLRAALPAIAAPGAARLATGMSDPTRQAACADSIPGTAGSLRAVEHISYLGRPAYVFVYADGARLTGYVVTEACGTTTGQPATVIAAVS